MTDKLTKYTHYCGKNRLPGIQGERPSSGQEGIEGEDNNFIFIFNKNFIWYWSIFDSQCCATFRLTVAWFSYTYMMEYSVQFSCSVMSNSLLPHELQHAKPSFPSPTPRVYSNSCPLSRWCHPTSWAFVIPFSSHLQSFPASGSFQMSQLFTSGGQSIGVSASTSVLRMNTQDWFP